MSIGTAVDGFGDRENGGGRRSGNAGIRLATRATSGDFGRRCVAVGAAVITRIRLLPGAPTWLGQAASDVYNFGDLVPQEPFPPLVLDVPIMTPPLPQGFRAAGVHCGVKRDPAKQDLTLVESLQDAVAVGVYTQNIVCAAPVQLDRSRTPTSACRVVVTNSGNANACTGDQGDRDARQMTVWAAEAVGAQEEQALVLSTGIIGEHLPMEKIHAGIQAATEQLAGDQAALEAAARGMMTTDTVHKIAGKTLSLDGQRVQITGLAKGSGMIGPRMATMLAVLLTDAKLDETSAVKLLFEAADRSFNCISVDGHTSTNDTVLLLANGATSVEITDEFQADFAAGVNEVCEDLARRIVGDGEGATHLITIDVAGCDSQAGARQIARTVADSPLVKTAVAGADPNWGRIVSAAGYAGVRFDPLAVSLVLNGTPLYENGRPLPFDAAAVSRSIREQHDTHIALRIGDGAASARFWTTDLTDRYVRINTDYRT